MADLDTPNTPADSDVIADVDITAEVNSTADVNSNADESDGLLSRVALIEQRPLEERAEAFTRLYDELRTALDRADTPTDG